MVAANSTKAAKVAALKKKLQPKGKKQTKNKKVDTVAARQQRAKSLTKAFSSNTALDFSRASTKHNTGRRDVCQSLDQSAAETGVSEALRGIGKADIPTAAQLAFRAKEERDQMAQAYEHERMALDQNIDDLANLMSGSS